MFHNLKQPYPLNLDTKKNIKESFLISLFVFLFLIIFQPFGLSNDDTILKYYLIAGYGVVCFLVLLFNLVIIPKILRNIFKEEHWSVYKRMLWLVWIVFSVGIGSYLFACMFFAFFDFNTLGFKEFILFQVMTLLIAIFPIIVCTLLNQIYLLRKNIKTAEEISAKLRDSESSLSNVPVQNQKVVVKSGNEREQCQFKDDSLLFICSEGNYVNIVVKNKKIERVLIRNSLTNIEKQLKNYPLFCRCHRAYIVNLNKIMAATGNAQGLKLTLEDLNESIPVARSYSKEFRKRLGIL